MPDLGLRRRLTLTHGFLLGIRWWHPHVINAAQANTHNRRPIKWRDKVMSF